MRLINVVLGLSLTACAAQTVTSRELVNARVEYARAAASNAPADAPKSLEVARGTLNAAEEEHAYDPGSVRERELAFLAMRRAQAAIADANARAAQRDAQLAREALRRNAEEAKRAAEAAQAQAQQAQAQADQAKAQAEAATKQAQTETERRQAAEQQAATAQQQATTAQLSLDQAERELTAVRSQLSAQGDKLDEQTKQLREREASLQAQVETLRSQRDQAEKERADAQRERDRVAQELRKVGEVAEEDRGLVLTLPSEVMFRHGQAALLPRAREKLDDLANALQDLGPDQKFVVEGHTDSTGSVAFNRRLSQRRANTVRAYLIEHGVDPDRIEAVGRGEAEPVASNANPEGRANNRRVEIVVTPPAVSRR